MNLYRGCVHNCAYCDGRSEGYYVEGQFGEDISVKTNAVELLKKELDPSRRRIPLKRSYIMLGGGVCDTYQPAEKKYGLTRNTLKVIADIGHPVHILTKSTLVERDLDLISEIGQKTAAILSISFSSVDGKICEVFEPGVPGPDQRLRTLERFKREGIACGMFLLPVVPFVTDTAEKMEESVKAGVDAGVDFIVFGGMSLKEGRQKEHFLKIIMERYPDLIGRYEDLYGYNRWGMASDEYYDVINEAFRAIAKFYRVPSRVPPTLYRNILEQNDQVIVILEHLDYLLRGVGQKTPFGFAAYSISQLKEPLANLQANLRSIKGVGRATEKIILEILGSGRCLYYEKLLYG